MIERVEKIMKEYPQMIMECTCLENQIKNFKGIDEEEMITTMVYSMPQEERIQTSGVSNKTARIAISYRDKMEQINSEWQEHLRKKYSMLYEEIEFFRAAVSSLSGILPNFINDMVFVGLTWDELADKYHVSRTMVAKYRKKAIVELDNLYALHNRELIEYILS